MGLNMLYLTPFFIQGEYNILPVFPSAGFIGLLNSSALVK
jgi:hypothetical protein